MAEVVTLASDKANPIIVNPLTRIWQVIKAPQVLSHSFLEFLKLVEIAMVHVLGFVEDEHCFSFASFFKTKLCNCLDPRLELAIAMFSQKCFLVLTTFLTKLCMIHGQMFTLQLGMVDMHEIQILKFG
jgi:hypothetical protein